MNCILCGNNTDKVITTRLRAGEGIPVYHCEGCDFGMLDTSHPNYKPVDYDGEYNEIGRTGLNKPSTPEEIFDAYVGFQQDRVDVIKKLRVDMDWFPVYLLDVGCSAGMFIHQIQEFVDGANGIDLDKACIEYAKLKCRGRGHQGQFYTDYLNRDWKYHILCMFQVLEHVDNPIEFLSNLVRWFMYEVGKICIEVPNLHDALVYVYDLPGHQQFYYHRAHLWYFTDTSLMRFMTMLGFEGKVEFVQDYGLLNHANWLMRDEPQTNGVAGMSMPE